MYKWVATVNKLTAFRINYYSLTIYFAKDQHNSKKVLFFQRKENMTMTSLIGQANQRQSRAGHGFAIKGFTNWHAGHFNGQFISCKSKASTLSDYHNLTWKNIPLLEGKTIKNCSSLLTLLTSPPSSYNNIFDYPSIDQNGATLQGFCLASRSLTALCMAAPHYCNWHVYPSSSPLKALMAQLGAGRRTDWTPR